MVEVVFALFLAWLLITVFGHLSWVVVRTFFRILTGQVDESLIASSTAHSTLPDPKADLEATGRVIWRLSEQGILDGREADALRGKLRVLEHQDVSTLGTLLPPESTPSRQSAAEKTPGRVDDVAEEAARVPPSPELAQDDPWTRPFDEPEAPLVATLVTEPSAERFAAENHSTGQPPVSVTATIPDHQETNLEPVETAPALSRAEIIQSFLAAHNIRWGELVAGMLIVVCSIGLVISLWSPLVETHRVLPSLIFLAANAAIFAAGLYTLSRWRLRHTSRAVLVIATLLVPLSVLAGLAAAGASGDAVQLNDPITLTGITLAGGVYLWLLYLSGRALVRKSYAVPMMIVIAGPVAILPIIPAAVRTMEAQAGWLLVGGSLAVVAACMMMIRARRDDMTLGKAGARTRILVIAFGAYSLAVSAGYLAFMVRHHGMEAYLAIALSAIPAITALAGLSRLLMKSARGGTQSIVGAIVYSLLLGIAWTTLPPSIYSQQWFWSWAIILSSSLLLLSWIAHQPRQAALATIPLGLATVMTSPIWIGDFVWGDLVLWRRVIGGEPMVAMAVVTFIVGILTVSCRRSTFMRPMAVAAAGWTTLLLITASILSVSPPSLLGDIPAAVVTCVLSVTAIAAAATSSRHLSIQIGALVAVAFTWLSVFQPIAIGEPLATGDVWMITLLAIGITLTSLCELLGPWAKWRGESVEDACSAKNIWLLVSSASLTATAGIACFHAPTNWTLSATYLGIVSACFAWNWTIKGNLTVLRFSQLVTIATAVVIGFGRFDQWLFTNDAWSHRQAPWAWAILIGLVCVGWLIIRDGVIRMVAFKPALSKRLGSFADSTATPKWMVDGTLVGIQTTLLVVGSVWSLFILFASATGQDPALGGPPWWLPVTSLTLGAVVSWFTYRQEVSDVTFHLFTSIVSVASLVWLSTELAERCPFSISHRVILATTLIALGGYVSSSLLIRRKSLLAKSTLQIASAVAITVVAIASVLLLQLHWYQPLAEGAMAELGPTAAVSAWWLIIAFGLLNQARRDGKGESQIASRDYSQHASRSSLLTASALLTPAAVAILVPAIVETDRIVWLQIAALASAVWILAVRAWVTERRDGSDGFALTFSSVFVSVTGIGSTSAVTLDVLFNVSWLNHVGGVACVLISCTALAMWLAGKLSLPWVLSDPSLSSDETPASRRLDRLSMCWPVVISILSGQAAWFVSSRGLTPAISSAELTGGLILIAGALSLARYRVRESVWDFGHVSILGLILFAASVLMSPNGTIFPWLALLGLTMLGLLAPITSTRTESRWSELGFSRLLGWLTVIGGTYLLLGQITQTTYWEQSWTITVVWISAWVLTWRLIHPHRRGDLDQRRHRAAIALGDMEFSGLLLAGLLVETLLATLNGQRFTDVAWTDPLLWLRVGSYIAVGFSGFTRGGRGSAWTLQLAMLTIASSLVASHVAISMEVTESQRWVWVLLPAGFIVALTSHWLTPLSRWMTRIAGDEYHVHLVQASRSTWRLASLVASFAAISTVAMIAASTPMVDAQLSTLTLVLCAWSVAVTAETSESNRLRYLAVFLGLASIGFLATIPGAETAEPFLAASMRWLVAAVLTIPTMIFLLPKLLGTSMAERWNSALVLGAKTTGLVATGSLIAMLIMEAGLHNGGRIAGVSIPLIIGVAVTLATLSLLATVIAILSGPRSSWREQLSLSDNERRILIVAAQGFAAVTWLHVYLCNSEWAFASLRQHWPYVVIALAFASVGAVEWSKRRKDEVMAGTLRVTALYLPMIPVLGFWLSGRGFDLNWKFIEGFVRYDVLLILGATYYLFISAIWKKLLPRVTGIVLANAAWWIFLIQQPNWEFLAHPQIWMIPPAACVLITVHLYRNQLQPSVTAAIRYAATLVIYISSTADMLIQQIGTSLSGPIILITLALFGMLLGVILRVRPFLYLGATFVFLGVTSMVWHAHHAFDAVWLWWVFGITTGICLLAGLMAIEKNKPKLRRYADNLATWNG